MTEKPLLTICVPAYNSEKTIAKTLSSILGQTYPNFEILFSDNNSTDNTLRIVESFKSPKIIVRKNRLFPEQNKHSYLGCYDNYNGCLQSGLIKGEFVAFWHSDDIYEKEIAERQVNFLMQHPEVGAVFTMAAVMDQNDKITGAKNLPKKLKSMKKEIFDFANIFKEILYNGNTFLITPTFMARTKIFKELGEFTSENDFGTSSDLEMWLRIAQKYPIAILQEKLMRHRTGGGGKSYLRNREKQADFFKAVDYYLNSSLNSLKIEKKYLRQYKYQKDFDNTLRAMNLLVKNETNKAKELITNPFSWKLAMAFFENITLLRIKVLLLKIILFFGINFGFGKFLGKTLRKIF